jgi:hypothetical protein
VIAMRALAVLFVAVVVLLAPHVAAAEDPLPGRMPELRLPPTAQQPRGPLVVGTWVEYSVYQRRTNRRVRLHWAFVGKDGGKQWWEMAFREGGRDPLVIKMLIRGSLHRADQMERVILQIGSGQPLELPKEQGQKLMDVYLRRPRGASVRDHGTVRLTVAAGTFSCRHFTWKDSEGQEAAEWTSEAARIFGLVRFRTPALELELINQGRGARSRVTRLPAKWHLPGR